MADLTLAESLSVSLGLDVSQFSSGIATATSGAQTFVDSVEEATAGIKKTMDDVSTAVGGVATSMEEATGRLVRSLPPITDAVGSMAAMTSGRIVQMKGSVGDALDGVAHGFATLAATSIGATAGFLDEMTAFGKGITDHLFAPVNSAPGIAEKAFGAVKTAIDTLINEPEKAGAAIANGLLTPIRALPSLAGAAIGAVGGLVTGALSVAASLALSAASAIANGVLSLISSAVSGVISLVTSAVSMGFSYLEGKISSSLKLIFGQDLSEIFDPTKAIEAASQFEGAFNKMQVAFGANAGAANAWATSYEQALGKGKLATTQMMAASQALFVQMGNDSQDALEMSQAVTRLASDMAAFGGGSDMDALHAIDAALQGNMRSLKQYGLAITDAQVKDELFREGIARDFDVQDQDVLSIARLNAIIRQSTLFQGQAAAQMNSFNGIMRQLGGVVQDIQVAMGEKLTKAVTTAINAMGGISRIRSEFSEIGDVIANGAASWVMFTGAAVGGFMDIVDKAGGPKKAVADLTAAVVDAGKNFASLISNAVGGFQNLTKWPTIVADSVKIAWLDMKIATDDVADKILQRFTSVALASKLILGKISPIGWDGIKQAAQDMKDFESDANNATAEVGKLTAELAKLTTAPTASGGPLSGLASGLTDVSADADQATMSSSDLNTMLGKLYSSLANGGFVWGPAADAVNFFAMQINQADEWNEKFADNLGGLVAPIDASYTAVGSAVEDMQKRHKAAMDGMTAEMKKQALYTQEWTQEWDDDLANISRGYNWDTDGMSIWANVANQAYGTVQERADRFLETIREQTEAYDEQRAAMLSILTPAGTSYGGAAGTYNAGGAAGADDPLGYSVFYGGGQHFATGGFVSGPPGTDRVPAMLTSGEFVVNPRAAAANAPALAAMNAGQQSAQSSARPVSIEAHFHVAAPITQDTVERVIMPALSRLARQGVRVPGTS